MFECILLPDSAPDSEPPTQSTGPPPLFKGTPEDLSRAFLEKQKLAYHETRAEASGVSWQDDPGSSKEPLIDVKPEKSIVSLGSLKEFPPLPHEQVPSTSCKAAVGTTPDSEENSSDQEDAAEDTLGDAEPSNETHPSNTKHIEHYAASFVDTWPVKNKYLDRSTYQQRAQKRPPSVNNEGTFTCEYCSRSFIRRYNYDKHYQRCRAKFEPKVKVKQRVSSRNVKVNDDVQILRVNPPATSSKTKSSKQKLISRIPKRRSLKNSGQFIKNTEGLYQCRTCHQVVQLQIEFEVHLNCGNKDGKSKYTCMVCGIKTKSRFEAQDHMVTEHCTVDSESESENTPLYFCHECDFNCSLKVVLDAHLAIHTAFKLKCKYCEINLMNKAQYDRHLMISHDNEVSQDVPTNSENEDTKDEIKNLLDIDETRLLEPECKLEASDDHFNDSTFRDDDNSDNESIGGKEEQEHAWQTVHIDSVLCSICNTTFPHIYKLYDHTEAEHRDHFHELRFVNKSKKKQAVKCDECKATFGFRTTLILHKLRHRGISPYVCKYCPSNFTSSSGLSHHCNRFHIKELEAESILRDPVVSKKGRKKSKDTENDNNESTESPKNAKTRENPDMILSQNQAVSESTIITLCTVCKTVFPNVVALYQHCTEYHANLKVIPVVRGNSNKPYGPFRCQDCNAGFMKMEDLRQHMIRHFDMKPFMCRACGNLYVSRSAAGYHYTTIHGPNCSRIRRSYNVPTMAEKHRLKLFSESNNFTCDFCHISFVKLKQLKDHIDQFHLLQQTENQAQSLLPMMAQHNLVPTMAQLTTIEQHPNMEQHNFNDFQNHEDDETEKFMVETCRKRVIRYDTPPVNAKKKKTDNATNDAPTTDNKSKNENANKLTCNICDKQFAHIHHLKKHIMKLHFTEKHPEFKAIIEATRKKVCKKLTCHLCLLIFPSKSKLRSHIMEHFSIPFKCKICREMMPYRQQLIDHICDEQRYPHKCYTCNRVFHEKVKLLRHQSRHVRSFPCDVCGKYFRFRNTLKRHKETIHEQVKKYLCPECGEVFGFSNQLDRHLQCHKQMKHACDSCPRKFWDLGQLQHHRNMEHREKRFICEICGRALSQKWHYNDHMRRHAGPLPRDFQCKECNLAYSSRNALHYHNKTRHPERVVKRN